jgi:Uma2 family endonuclease
MSSAVSIPQIVSPPLALLPAHLLRRFTVDEYHQMIRTGILSEDEPVELLDGWITNKMPRNPEHDLAVEKLDAAIRSRIPPGWRIRIQSAITTDASEPEPDMAIVRGPLPASATSHPRPGEVAMLVEVADSSLDYDRTMKGQAYAQAAVPIYWIVNLRERQVEVRTDPTGTGPTATYRSRQDYGETESVPLVLDGAEIGRIPARELLV